MHDDNVTCFWLKVKEEMKLKFSALLPGMLVKASVTQVFFNLAGTIQISKRNRWVPGVQYQC